MYGDFEKAIEILKTQYEQEKSYTKYLREQLNEYNKDEEIAKRDDLIKRLNSHSLFTMSDKEKEDHDAFIKKHYKLHNDGKFKAIGNTYVYTLTGTGLGTLIKIKCPICGEEIDITDTSTW